MMRTMDSPVRGQGIGHGAGHGIGPMIGQGGSGVLRQQVTVWADPEGVPERFVFRGRRFRITRRPLQWLARDSARADRSMWQVVAQSAEGEVLVLDLYADSEQPSRWWAVDVRG